MKTENNFISVVCIGNFNPSILTPDFLAEVCGFKFEDSPKGGTSPVLSRVAYGNLEFLVELQKLQILERSIQDFRNSKVIGYFEEYVNILKHTPIFACGVNLNVNVADFAPDAVKKNLDNRDMIFDLLGAKEVVFEKKDVANRERTEEDWVSHDFRCVAEEDSTLHLNVSKGNSVITVNLNFEVRGLDKDSSRVGLIGHNLGKLVDKNEIILKSIMEVTE